MRAVVAAWLNTYPLARVGRSAAARRPARVAQWALLALSLLFAAPLAAQEAANDRAASFEAVSGAVHEDVPGGPLMVAAYGLIWVAVLAYVYRLVRLHKHVDENLARLQQDLAKATKHLETQK